MSDIASGKSCSDWLMIAGDAIKASGADMKEIGRLTISANQKLHSALDALNYAGEAAMALEGQQRDETLRVIAELMEGYAEVVKNIVPAGG